jgi:flagellar biosynthesis GTPase FlhF
MSTNLKPTTNSPAPSALSSPALGSIKSQIDDTYAAVGALNSVPKFAQTSSPAAPLTGAVGSAVAATLMPALSSAIAGMTATTSSSGGGGADDKFHAPKKPSTQDVKIKNVGSWSSLASLATNTQTPGSNSNTVKKSTTAMSFELFKRQAKEKEERERAEREQAELRRRKQEQELAERAKAERERQRAREEEEALENALKAQQRETERQQHTMEQQIMSQKERERLREQERRRLAAKASRIDMTAQSELMASFEENL